MPKYEINFGSYSMIEAESPIEAEMLFKEFMAEEYPEFEVDRVYSATEIK